MDETRPGGPVLRDVTHAGPLTRSIWLPNEQLLLPLSVVIPEDPRFSEEFIEDLHVYLLRISLAHLRDPRVGSDERKDCLRWIFGIPNAPFSCAECCRVAGFDFNAVQELVENEIERQRRAEQKRGNQGEQEESTRVA